LIYYFQVVFNYYFQLSFNLLIVGFHNSGIVLIVAFVTAFEVAAIAVAAGDSFVALIS
jgi:hypothetical protein